MCNARTTPSITVRWLMCILSRKINWILLKIIFTLSLAYVLRAVAKPNSHCRSFFRLSSHVPGKKRLNFVKLLCGMRRPSRMKMTHKKEISASERVFREQRECCGGSCCDKITLKLPTSTRRNVAENCYYYYHYYGQNIKFLLLFRTIHSSLFDFPLSNRVHTGKEIRLRLQIERVVPSPPR